MNLKRIMLILSILGICCFWRANIWDSQSVNWNLQNAEIGQECIQIQNTKDGFCVGILYDDREEIVYPWYDETTKIWEVFLPSYLNTNEEIKCCIQTNKLQILNVPIEDDYILLRNKTIYELVGEDARYTFRINLSKNISSLFIETQSGSMENLNRSKENKERGMISSVNSEGSVEYAGILTSISGHGNGTWNKPKRPYNLQLATEGNLAGLEAAKNWALLALHYEGDKIHSKVAYELEKILGGAYPSECTWVDVYFNGNYHGIYLLIDSIKGRDGFQFDEDGFLIEKEIQSRLINDYFVTQQGESFTLKRSAESSLEEVGTQVQICEDNIYSTVLDENIIDLESFATQFLINTISLNFDSFKTSSYYYKLDNDSKLYAGPCWDYDGAFAEYLHQGENWVNPKGTVFEGEERLKWYKVLYENPTYYQCVVEQFEEHLEEINSLVNEKIDEYAEHIQAAVINDDLRWKFTEGTLCRAGTYQTWENDVRYLKYFLNHRLQYLADLWEIEGKQFVWSPTEELHTVKFMSGNEEIKVLQIPDGEVIQSFPDQDGVKWCFDYSSEYYEQSLPILEDCILIPGQ